MAKIRAAEAFQKYIDPHKPEVAEWGAQVGFWGGHRSVVRQRLAQLAETEISRAALDELSVPLERQQRRVQEMKGLQSTIKSRIRVAFDRFVRTWPYSSASRFRRAVETLFDIAAVVFLRLFLLLILLCAALAEWRLDRIKQRRDAVLRLKNAAITRLTEWFEIHADLGEMAATVKKHAVANDPGGMRV